MPSRRHILGAFALTPGTSFAFERDGARKVLVFSGNQAVPVLDIVAMGHLVV